MREWGFVLLLALAGCATSDPRAEAPNVFRDASAGFEVTKPADWHWFEAERGGRKVLVAFSKYVEPYDDLNPSFEVVVEPTSTLEGKGVLVALRTMLEAQRRELGGRVETEPRLIDVAGKQAAYARLDYDAVLPDGRTLPVAVETWVVPAGQRVFFLDAGTRPDEKTGSRDEIAAIVRSVRITP
jgi:hypothetical protein